MQTPKPSFAACLQQALLPLLVTILALASSCSRDPSFQAIESDANGYVCTNPKCGVKLYTDRKVFLDPKCPKCSEYTLTEVNGYVCDKDKHLTLRPRVRGPAGAAVCEQCGAQLANAMVSPHAKDLKAWGAVKAP